MKAKKLHDWKISVHKAKEIQKQLVSKVSRNGEVVSPKYIAGVDIAAGRANEMAQAAVVVLSYPEMQMVEFAKAQGRLELPYIPGLLSFRESPLILDAFCKIKTSPDIIMIDGQGIAHPRRLGIASHLGLLLDKTTIGCAKSRLCGSSLMPGDETGSYAEITDNGEIIAVTLRTKTGVKPLYISIGHKINLENAVYWVMRCCRGYRLPEPTRLAHLVAGGKLN
ncbi:MAG: deoxyribonuclease V [Chloroflexota bacterium]